MIFDAPTVPFLKLYHHLSGWFFGLSRQVRIDTTDDGNCSMKVSPARSSIGKGNQQHSSSITTQGSNLDTKGTICNLSSLN